VIKLGCDGGSVLRRGFYGDGRISAGGGPNTPRILSVAYGKGNWQQLLRGRKLGKGLRWGEQMILDRMMQMDRRLRSNFPAQVCAFINSRDRDRDRINSRDSRDK
jgi:hypothetical protein